MRSWSVEERAVREGCEAVGQGVTYSKEGEVFQNRVKEVERVSAK